MEGERGEEREERGEGWVAREMKGEIRARFPQTQKLEVASRGRAQGVFSVYTLAQWLVNILGTELSLQTDDLPRNLLYLVSFGTTWESEAEGSQVIIIII